MSQYPTMISVYECYRKAYSIIIFEGKPYRFKCNIRLNDVTKHVYRNEEEQHTLFIHLLNGKPFYVDAVYSVQGV